MARRLRARDVGEGFEIDAGPRPDVHATQPVDASIDDPQGAELPVQVLADGLQDPRCGLLGRLSLGEDRRDRVLCGQASLRHLLGGDVPADSLGPDDAAARIEDPGLHDGDVSPASVGVDVLLDRAQGPARLDDEPVVRSMLVREMRREEVLVGLADDVLEGLAHRRTQQGVGVGEASVQVLAEDTLGGSRSRASKATAGPSLPRRCACLS